MNPVLSSSERRESSGTYTVSANCTANAQIKIGDTSYNMNFMIAGNRATIFYSEVGPDSVITGQMIRTAAP